MSTVSTSGSIEDGVCATPRVTVRHPEVCTKRPLWQNSRVFGARRKPHAVPLRRAGHAARRNGLVRASRERLRRKRGGGSPDSGGPVSEVNNANLVGVWQQGRWSNEGARGNLGAASFDGGRSWTA